MWNAFKDGILQWDKKKLWKLQIVLVFFFKFKTLNAWNCSLNNIVEGKYKWTFFITTIKWGLLESLVQSPV
jgi:hypothetical protein